MTSRFLTATAITSVWSLTLQTRTNTQIFNERMDLGEWFDADRSPICIALWNDPVELIFDGDAMEPTQLERITSGLHSSVYGIIGDPSRVVVYRVFTHMIRSSRPDPAVRDFWFLNFLRDSTVVPKVHAISARLDAVSLPEGDHGKVYIPKYNTDIESTSVRYIVMERVIGSTFEEFSKQYIDHIVPIELAADLGISAIAALKTIHSLNVIHCDVHARNMMCTLDVGVKLIDFEDAMLFSPSDAQSRCSFREDILRSLIVVGMLICGTDYEVYAHHILLGSPPSEFSRLGVRLNKFIKRKKNFPISRLDGIIRSLVATDVPDYEIVTISLQELKNDAMEFF